MHVRAHNIFQHVKTGNLYIVDFLALDTTNARDGEHVVVYRRWRPDAESLGAAAGPFVRELSEFCDGRFVLMYEQPPHWK